MVATFTFTGGDMLQGIWHWYVTSECFALFLFFILMAMLAGIFFYALGGFDPGLRDFVPHATDEEKKLAFDEPKPSE